jgi:hypothetical protein
MKRRTSNLAHRRRLLLEKIGAQRNDLAQLAGHFERPLAWADTGLRAARYLHDHPAVLAGGVAAFLALRRSGLLGLAKTGWRLLYLYPSLLGFAWQALSPRRVVTKSNTQTEKGA